MLPSSMLTFISLTHAPSTPLSVLVARATATLMASSKLVSDVALNSVTRAMLMVFASLLDPSLPLICLVCSLIERRSNIIGRGPSQASTWGLSELVWVLDDRHTAALL